MSHQLLKYNQPFLPLGTPIIQEGAAGLISGRTFGLELYDLTFPNGIVIQAKREDFQVDCNSIAGAQAALSRAKDGE